MIRYVMSEDISNILSMMEQVKEAFPGYQEIEFLEALYKAIDCKTAFLEEREGRLAGMLIRKRSLHFWQLCRNSENRAWEND